MKVGFISLGCSKNLVITEEMIGIFKKHKYEIVSNPEEAEIIIINTCGFIESAKDEGIKTILEMADYKKYNCKYLIVTGCLVQRYKEQLQIELPEVDLFISINEYQELWEKIEYLIHQKKEKDQLDFHHRVITTTPNYAYLKIAEGCNNYCTYCAIPYIQGKYISRPIEDVIKEANILAEKGYEEIIIIAQDTTKYGIDLYGKPKLVDLLREISKIDGIKWIRFLYSYPETITDELILEVKTNPKICKYFDIPIQHISNNILKKMNRKSDTDSIKKLIEKLRKEIDDVIIRTTLIVGFPGETEEDFKELENFVKTYKFNHLGAFAYSKEDGTVAAKMPNQIDEKIKIQRRNRIMEIQQQISKNNLKKYIGQEYIAIIENITDDEEYYIGRTYMDVPEEDGVVFIKYDPSIIIGEYVKIKIINSKEYDLVGLIIK